MKTISKNRKAFRDYDISETFEAGIVLVGSEVKSIRAGMISLKDSFAKIKNGELWLYGMHISPYVKSSVFQPEPGRRRKLLMHKREIIRIKSKTEERGLTLIPLEVYINARGKVKIKIGIAKGRKQYQKKQYLLEKQKDREKERELRDYLKRKKY
ncbi:SsrA-binding protein SmpB [bacterium]|nr:SsrA-binding protein SmpB [bacterium]